MNFTFGAATSEDDNPAAASKTLTYAKVGYITGKHSVSIDYGRGEDFDLSDDRSESIGLGYVYAAQKWLDVYAGVKQHKLSRSSQGFDDISFATGGMRLKF